MISSSEFFMLLNPKKWIIAGLIMLPVHAMAGTSTASFNTITNTQYIDINNPHETMPGTDYDTVANVPSYIYNQFEVVVGGQTITVSAWSDTRDGDDFGTADGDGDNTIERAVDFDRNDNGWSVENRDEGQGAGSPDHSADNIGNGNWNDYDFYLLDFGSQSVNLNSVYSSWSHNPSDTQVSVAALDASSIASDLTGQTYSSLLSGAQGVGSTSFTTSKSSYSFDNDSNRNNYYADVSSITGSGTASPAASSLWVVSTYNTLFGTASNATANNDGFKLAGVQFTTADCCGGGGKPIPEPTTIALLTLAMFGLGANRRRR